MTLLSRIFGRPAAPVATRRFDAATGRRWEGTPVFGSVGGETLAAHPGIQACARYYVANNPWAAAGVNALVAGLVGPGIRAAGSPEATAAFDAWARVADADGRTDLWGLQAAAVRATIVDGESFALLEDGPDGLRVRLLPAEMVDAGRTMNLPGGGYIIGGIEFDAGGAGSHTTSSSSGRPTYSAPARRRSACPPRTCCISPSRLGRGRCGASPGWRPCCCGCGN